MGLEQYLGATYKLAESEKFDELMQELGVDLETSKMAKNLSTSATLTEKDGVYTYLYNSNHSNAAITFQLGKEFDETTVDGRKVRSVITLEGENKLVHVQRGTITTTIAREFTPDHLILTITANNVVAVRKFNRVK